MLKVSDCQCKYCKCVPFIKIWRPTTEEPRRVDVACKCRKASVETDPNAKRSEVKEAVVKYMATPCGVTR